MSRTDADVAVVGYGPTGMTTAALLARAGYQVVVLERYPGLDNLPRAAIFDDETMRTFAMLGAAEPMLPKVHVPRSYQWRNGAGELLIEQDVAAAGRCGWAESYTMYQPDLEDALDRACRAAPGLRIRHNAQVTELDQADGHVTLKVPGTAAVTARYAVACDGGDSFTRQALGIGQHDYGFSEPWLVCDFRLRRAVTLPTAMQLCDPAQPAAIISLGPRHHRFSFMLDSGQDFDTERQPERVWARVARWLGPDDAGLVRAATYTFRSLVADRWRDGRILLAGDAAHELPPFPGQGMCAGVRDAQNLAFKLDLVLRGRAQPWLLDTYQAEREPHVRAVIEEGIELGRVQTMRDPVAAAERDRRLRAERAAHQAPARLRFPGLAGGLLAEPGVPGRGELFIQDLVAEGPRRGRFDELAGTGLLLLVTLPLHRALRDRGTLAALRLAGLRVVALAPPPAEAPAEVPAAAESPPMADARPGIFVDLSGAYHRWLDEHGCRAVLIRPDFYVYGGAADVESAEALAAGLLARIRAAGPGPEPVSAAGLGLASSAPDG